MKRKVINKEQTSAPELVDIDFDLDAVAGGSSGEAFTARPPRERPAEKAEAAEEDLSVSPVFKLLSRPVLPELESAPRGRLMMQSPTRLFFYWAVGGQSYQALHKALGGAAGDYRLVVRILDLSGEAEELHPIEPEGSRWFNVSAGAEYRAEVGFYSTSRPFVRVLFSNTVATPRKSPSPRSSADAGWAVTTGKFVEVLDASGFEADAMDVIRSETNEELGARFARHLGIDENDAGAFDLGELRKVLALLAAGSPIEDFKWKVSAELYALLQAHHGKLSQASVGEMFDVDESGEPVTESYTAVGGSLVSIRRRRFRPVSSFQLG